MGSGVYAAQEGAATALGAMFLIVAGFIDYGISGSVAEAHGTPAGVAVFTSPVSLYLAFKGISATSKAISEFAQNDTALRTSQKTYEALLLKIKDRQPASGASKEAVFEWFSDEDKRGDVMADIRQRIGKEKADIYFHETRGRIFGGSMLPRTQSWLVDEPDGRQAKLQRIKNNEAVICKIYDNPHAYKYPTVDREPGETMLESYYGNHIAI